MSSKDNADKKKKRIITVIIVLVCAVPVMYLLMQLLDRDWDMMFREAELSGRKSETTEVIRFSEVDFEEDIFEDAAYLDKNRYISYTEGAVTVLITDGDAAAYGVGAAFFELFFDAVINGNSGALDDLCTDSFIEENGVFEPFTMQKIYNISVEKLSENVIESGEYVGVKQYVYRVSYMIKDNNGTFRDDIESDAARPQVFELIDTPSGVRLNSIGSYSYVG